MFIARFYLTNHLKHCVFNVREKISNFCSYQQRSLHNPHYNNLFIYTYIKYDQQSKGMLVSVKITKFLQMLYAITRNRTGLCGLGQNKRGKFNTQISGAMESLH